MLGDMTRARSTHRDDILAPRVLDVDSHFVGRRGDRFRYWETLPARYSLCTAPPES
jgi:hypothetical protein